MGPSRAVSAHGTEYIPSIWPTAVQPKAHEVSRLPACGDTGQAAGQRCLAPWEKACPRPPGGGPQKGPRCHPALREQPTLSPRPQLSLSCRGHHVTGMPYFVCQAPQFHDLRQFPRRHPRPQTRACGASPRSADPPGTSTGRSTSAVY